MYMIRRANIKRIAQIGLDQDYLEKATHGADRLIQEKILH